MHKLGHSGEWPSPLSVTTWPTTTVAGVPSDSPLARVPGGTVAEEESGTKTMILKEGMGNGCKHGAATTTTMNMMLTMWHLHPTRK